MVGVVERFSLKSRRPSVAAATTVADVSSTGATSAQDGPAGVAATAATGDGEGAAAASSSSASAAAADTLAEADGELGQRDTRGGVELRAGVMACACEEPPPRIRVASLLEYED